MFCAKQNYFVPYARRTTRSTLKSARRDKWFPCSFTHAARNSGMSIAFVNCLRNNVAGATRTTSMWLYAARRILLAVPIALGVTVICYGLVYLAPGDPVQTLLPPDATQADVAYLKQVYGFDKPIPLQYLKWLARAASGDLGTSIQTNRPVLGEVTRALSHTLIVSFGAGVGGFPLAFM